VFWLIPISGLESHSEGHFRSQRELTGYPANNVSCMAKTQQPFDAADTSRIIEMAWEDRTPFEAIEVNFGLNESAVITLMRRELKPTSFRMWRKRVTNRATKHAALRVPGVYRAYCATQYKP
jgi:uncharacterized protein (TIGR03643 family)